MKKCMERGLDVNSYLAVIYSHSRWDILKSDLVVCMHRNIYTGEQRADRSCTNIGFGKSKVNEGPG